MNKKRTIDRQLFALLLFFLLYGTLMVGCHGHEHLQVMIQMPCTGDSATNGICKTIDSTSRSIILRGDPNELFTMKIRIRGILEQRAYPSGKSRSGMWQSGGSEGNMEDTANIYKLKTSNPGNVYYLNVGKSNINHTFKIDTVVTIQSYGEAILTLTGLSVDGKERSNQDQTGNPMEISSVKIKKRPYNGQYVQVNVLSQKKLKGS